MVHQICDKTSIISGKFVINIKISRNNDQSSRSTDKVGNEIKEAAEQF